MEEDIEILEKMIDIARKTNQDMTLANKIEHLIKEYKKKDKLVHAMATKLSEVCTGITAVREQFEKCYCEFINSDEDLCWKTDKTCDECIIEYFTKEVEREVEQ